MKNKWKYVAVGITVLGGLFFYGLQSTQTVSPPPPSNLSLFDSKIQSALAFLKTQSPTLARFKATTRSDYSSVLAIVFPELIRFSALQDFMEAEANEWLYVQKGSQTADFSIGEFQMRPSFIENMEQYVDTCAALSNFRHIVIKKTTISESRHQRIQRLQQFEWQLCYAQVFFEIAQHRFRHRSFKNETDRIHFFATAYNFGFLRPTHQIEAWQQRRAFPFGSKHNGEQAAYGDFAVYFLTHHSRDF